MPLHAITIISNCTKTKTAGEKRYVQEPKRLQLTILFGILLSLVGTNIFGYSFILIEEQEQTVNPTEVTLNQLLNFENSKIWWKNVCVNLIFPLTSVFIFIGGITLFSQGVLQHVKNKKNTITKLQNELLISKKQTKIKKEKIVETS